MSLDSHLGLIIHTEASTGRGGQEARIFSEMNYLRAQGYRCVMMAPQAADIFARCQQSGYECIPIEFTKWSQIFDFFRLWTYFSQNKPLMVGTHSSVDSRVALAAATMAGVPVRIRYRHVSTQTTPTFFNKYLYKNLCDAVITTGDIISDNLAEAVKIPREKIHTIATGIQPPPVMMDREAARTKLQQELSLPSDTRFIGMMAEMRSWKGHRPLMNAFGKVLEKFPNYHLVFVGGGESLDFYKTFASELPYRSHIHFTGHQKEFYDYFRAWDVALLASVKNEGIPQTLLHAMFAQTPVVGTQVGGIPEIVFDGKTGLLVPGDDEEALAQAIVNVLENSAEAHKRVKNALENVQKNHTWDVMGQKVIKLIENVSSVKKAQRL